MSDGKRIEELEAQLALRENDRDAWKQQYEDQLCINAELEAEIADQRLELEGVINECEQRAVRMERELDEARAEVERLRKRAVLCHEQTTRIAELEAQVGEIGLLRLEKVLELKHGERIAPRILPAAKALKVKLDEAKAILNAAKAQRIEHQASAEQVARIHSRPVEECACGVCVAVREGEREN